MKKRFILTAALVIALLGLYGCRQAGTDVTETTAVTEAAEIPTIATEATEAPAKASTEPAETEAPAESNPAENSKPQGGADQPGTTGSSGQQTGSSRPSGSTGGGNTSGTPAATQTPVTEPPAAASTEHTHNYRVASTIPATCTREGTTTYTCACGDSYTETIPKGNHNYTAASTVPATCTSEGTTTYVCTCGDSYTETIPATGHSWVHHHEDEVGHDERGCICRCGAIFSTTAEWSAHSNSYDNLEALTNHGGYASYSEWVVDTPARDWDECAVCGATK